MQLRQSILTDGFALLASRRGGVLVSLLAHLRCFPLQAAHLERDGIVGRSITIELGNTVSVDLLTRCR